MEPTPKEYRLPAEDLSSVNKHAINSAASLILMYGAIIAVIEYSNRDKPPGTIPIWALLLPFLGFIVFRQYQKSKAEWRTYKLLVQPDGSLQRSADGVPDITIASENITQIMEVQDSLIMVKSNNALQFIIIPAKLIGLDEVRAHLQSVKPITQTKPMPPVVQYIVPLAAAIGLFWAAFLSKDRLLAGGASAVTAALLIWVLIHFRNDKSITPDQRTLAIVVISVSIFVQFLNLFAQLFPNAVKHLVP